MKKVLLFLLVGLLPVGLFAQKGDNNQQETLVCQANVIPLSEQACDGLTNETKGRDHACASGTSVALGVSHQVFVCFQETF